jgi:CheY-like chemotaxis protein
VASWHFDVKRDEMTNFEILIANHDRRAANDVATSLRRSGYNVSLAYTSDEAIQSAKREPALLIIDPVMPGLSGLEAASHIFAATGCKILLLTDLAGDVDFQDLLSGLVRDGIDCAAFTTKRPSADLVAYVQAAIGLEDTATAPENEFTTSCSPRSTERSSDNPPRANEVVPTGHAQDSPYAHGATSHRNDS